MVPRVRLVRLVRPGLESPVARLGLGRLGGLGGAGREQRRGPGTAAERPTPPPVAPPPTVSPYPPLPDDEPNGRRSGPSGHSQLGPGQPGYGQPGYGGASPYPVYTPYGPDD